MLDQGSMQWVFKIGIFVLSWAVVIVNLTGLRHEIKKAKRRNEKIILATFLATGIYMGILYGYILVRLIEVGPVIMVTGVDDLTRTGTFLLMVGILIESISRGAEWIRV